jgi:glycosyltransferase involved in cell wall biosynthesis
MASNSFSSRVAPRRVAKTTVAAILPLYNGELWVEGAIKSVLNQSLLPDEFFVVDDGSTDGGVAIVRDLAKRHPLITILSQPNAGQSAARNFAIARAKSDYIALIDQDDLWYANHIEELVRAATKHRGLKLGWVYSDFDDIDIDGHMVSRNFIERMRTQNPKRELVAVLGEGFVIQPSATLITRAAILEVGGFDERLSGYEDDDLFLRIFLANYDNVFLKDPTSQWRIHASSSGGTDRMEESLRIYTQKLLDAFPNDRWRGLYFRSDLIAPRMIRTWIQMYVRASRYKNRPKMKLYAREARKLLPYLRPKARMSFGLALFVMRQPVFMRMRTATVENTSIGWLPVIAIGRSLVKM